MTAPQDTLDPPRAPGTAVAVVQTRPVQMLRPIAQPAEVVRAQEETRELVAKALVKDRDFGVIPGTQKPTMLKPGAERVALAFGCYYGEPIILEREIDHDRIVHWTKRKKNYETGEWEESSGESIGLYRYVVKVPVINRATGEVVGAGIGACSTMESKYVDRPRDSENTALKMAHKRALVAACLITFGLSDQFTQDVEDNPDAVRGEGPACPKCNGPMWDNRKGKKNPKAPDFKCRDRKCEGVYWPGEWPPKEQKPADATPIPILQRKVGKGKEPELTWGALVEKSPAQVQYAIDHWKSLTVDEKQELATAIERVAMRQDDVATASAAAVGADTEDDDDIPF